MGCCGPSAKARQSEKAIKLHKHPKNGRPLLRIQPMHMELVKAISHDVYLERRAFDVVEQIDPVDASVVPLDTVVVAVVPPVVSVLESSGHVDEYPEPDPYHEVGFGWDDPDDF